MCALPLIGYAEAWSPSTPGDVVGIPVMTGGRTASDVTAMKSQLFDAWLAPLKDDQRIPRPEPAASGR